MAVLALSFVGAGIGGAIGGSFLGVSAASIGWAAGSVLGNLLFAPDGAHTEGPRLGDMSVQASTYGTMKPIVYGAMRVNGNVIFCTNKREVATTTEGPGKGGDPPTSTTYTYNVDLAIALCENQIRAIRKVMNNGALIYDLSSGASIETVMASGVNAVAFTVYYGTETQLPDPTMEATKGAGNVPAYRGMAYVVFTGLDCPNGQIPQFSFEVLTEATDVVRSLDYGKVIDQLVTNSARAVITEDGVFNYGYMTTGPVPGPQPVIHLGRGFQERLPDTPSAANLIPALGGGMPYALSVDGLGQHAYSHDLTNGSEPVQIWSDTSSDSNTKGLLQVSDLGAYDASTGKFILMGFIGQPPTDTGVLVMPSGVFIGAANPNGQTAIFRDMVYNPEGTNLNVYSAIDATLVEAIPLPAGVGGNGVIPLATDTGLYLLKLSSGTIGVGSSSVTIYRYSAPGWERVALNASVPDNEGKVRTFWANNEYAIVGPTSGGEPNSHQNGYWLIPFRSVEIVEPFVADIIDDIAARAGLPADQINTSAVTDQVHGYAITSVSSARANIQPLQKCFFIDAVESDGVLRFTPRADLANAAFIGYDDLGAAPDGNDPTAALALQRTQEDELPRSVAISYINYAADYQTGTETSRRIVTESINDLVDQLPVATTPERAATVADVLLYDAWNERNKRSLTTLRKFAYLDAGDVVTVEYPRGVLSAKRLTRATDDGVTCQFEAVDSDADIYTVNVPGASPPTAQDGVPLISPSRLQVLDIPLLRDADNNPGVYVALNGASAIWPGAALYTGQDDASLAPRGVVTDGAPIGIAQTVLGVWTSRIMDEKNTVDVTVNRGELFNATREAVFDSIENAAVLGDEIIQFCRAVNVAGNVWRLSGLLRGLRGTEAAIGTHVIGERFVMLRPSGMLRPLYDVSEIGSPRRFRAVTLGKPLNSAKSIGATNTGEGLRPFSPVNLRRLTSTGTDVGIAWDRRTRSTATFPANGVDVPLFESSEAYSIDIYSSTALTTVVRTIDASAATITYTTAQQTADGLTPGAPVSVRVYQVSSDVGRGHYLQGTI